MKTRLFGILALLLLAVGGARASSTVPELGNNWVNGPYSLGNLKDKVVVFYFFETGCPKCRARWPEMDKVRKSFENDPVLFIGVNSNNTARSLATYAKEVKTEWPYYVDSDRSFEQAVLKSTISLQNIYQAMLLTPSGELKHINPDMAEDVKKELPRAKWNMDPKDIPAALKPAWRALEFGQTSKAVTTIKQALTSSDAKVKEAAQKLEAVVKEDIAKRMTDAAAKVAEDKKWDGYKTYDGVVQNYKMYPEAQKATAEMGKLRGDKKVAKELQAKMMLDKIQEWTTSPRKTERDQVKPGLEMLQAQYGDTEAGEASKSVKAPESKEKEKP